MLAAIAKLSMGLLCAGFLSLLVCYVARADGQACGRRRDRRCLSNWGSGTPMSHRPV